MKKYILLFSLLVFAVSLLNAQQNANLFNGTKKCATMEVFDSHVQQEPALLSIREQMETAAQQWKREKLFQKTPAPIITIPVVFHVIYNVDSLHQNIPDSVIYSQLEVLNEDFRRLNADTDDVRSIFDSLSSDIGIEFCLATVDPDGNPTTGIIRTSTSVKAFEFLNNQQDDMKFASTGGDDAWPKDSYLNIWTCYMTIFNSPGVLGYSHFPWDTAASKDGVVLLYNAVGRYSKVFEMPQGEGKTATHEVGHWLGLFHIWGNESFFPGCDSSDYVDDTPNQNGQSNFDCNKTINSCSNELSYWGPQNPPDMVENYMDYSNDTCMCMFSAGQKERMLSFLNTSRVGLFSSAGCSGSASAPVPLSEDPKFRLYPNPSDGKFSVVSPEDFTLEMYTVYGDLAFSKNNCQSENTLHLPDLPPGFYFVKVATKKSGVATLPLFLSAP